MTPTYGTIGKRNAQIIDYIHALRRVVTLEELAKQLGVRKNNLKKRNLNLLVELELLEEVDGGYVTPTDIEKRLNDELRESGQLEAEKVQAQRYERERKVWWKSANATQHTVLIQDKQPQTRNEAKVTEIPKKADVNLIKNLPPKSEDGIYEHGSLCDCFMCEEYAPEYIPAIEEEEAVAA